MLLELRKDPLSEEGTEVVSFDGGTEGDGGGLRLESGRRGGGCGVGFGRAGGREVGGAEDDLGGREGRSAEGRGEKDEIEPGVRTHHVFQRPIVVILTLSQRISEATTGWEGR